MPRSLSRGGSSRTSLCTKGAPPRCFPGHAASLCPPCCVPGVTHSCPREDSGRIGHAETFVREFEIRAVHLSSNCVTGLPAVSQLWPGWLRHPKHSTYGCFFPDLTRFVALRCAGPNHQHRSTGAVPKTTALGQEFDPAIADCGCRAPLAPRLAQPLSTLPNACSDRQIRRHATFCFG